MGDQPMQVSLSDLGAIVIALSIVTHMITVTTVLWRVARAVSEIRIKVDQMWHWFQRTQIRGFETHDGV